MLQEAYPQLRSNENFLKLQDEIAGTENRIATARNDYNGGVQDYNTDARAFPDGDYSQAFWIYGRALFQGRRRREAGTDRSTQIH